VAVQHEDRDEPCPYWMEERSRIYSRCRDSPCGCPLKDRDEPCPYWMEER